MYGLVDVGIADAFRKALPGMAAKGAKDNPYIERSMPPAVCWLWFVVIEKKTVGRKTLHDTHVRGVSV